MGPERAEETDCAAPTISEWAVAVGAIGSSSGCSSVAGGSPTALCQARDLAEDRQVQAREVASIHRTCCLGGAAAMEAAGCGVVEAIADE
jgi:hypothetical protein